MTDVPGSGQPGGLGVPWICETCGHFMVLHDGRDASESVCRDAGGPHRLTAYTGTEMAIAIRNERDKRLRGRDRQTR